MIAASFERLVSIVFPFKSKLSKHKCILIIFLIWILAMCASLPWVFILHVEHINIFVMNRIDLTSHKNDLAENHFDFSGDLSENFMLDLKENQNESIKTTQIIYKILSNKDFKENDFAAYLDSMDKNSTKEIIEVSQKCTFLIKLVSNKHR